MRPFSARRDGAPRHERGRWRHLPAALAATAFLLPLVFMVTGSLRKAGLPPPRTPELVPSEPTLESYRRAFELVDLARYTCRVAAALPECAARRRTTASKPGTGPPARLTRFGVPARSAGSPLRT